MDKQTSIYERAYFNLLKTGSWIEHKLKDALKELNITHSQLNVLHILHENDPKPVPAFGIKEKILVSSPDITRLLDRLVKKGYVERVTCPENRRKIDISLTKEGRDVFLKAHSLAKKAVRNFFEDQISIEEAQELRRILQKIRV